MIREVDIIKYWQIALQDVLEFRKIAETENPEFVLTWEGFQKVWDNQYIDTLTVEGCIRWEKLLGISPKASDTLADRRFAILTKINGDLPYTWNSLLKKLNTLCEGDNEITMTYDNDNFILSVKVALTSKKHLNEVADLLERIVPANIIYDCDLKYNTYQMLRDYTHQALQAYTHEQLRNEVLN